MCRIKYNLIRTGLINGIIYSIRVQSRMCTFLKFLGVYLIKKFRSVVIYTQFEMPELALDV